jgi:hypothetical protein
MLTNGILPGFTGSKRTVAFLVAAAANDHA